MQMGRCIHIIQYLSANFAGSHTSISFAEDSSSLQRGLQSTWAFWAQENLQVLFHLSTLLFKAVNVTAFQECRSLIYPRVYLLRAMLTPLYKVHYSLSLFPLLLHVGKESNLLGCLQIQDPVFDMSSLLWAQVSYETMHGPVENYIFCSA